MSLSNYEGRETLSIMQATKRVQVSRRTIYNWLRSGRLDYVRTAGGAVRIFADTLMHEKEPNDRLKST